MQLIEIQDKNKLNDFLNAQSGAKFLQSWQWGEFQEKSGQKIFRLGVEENGELIAVATLIKNSLPFGKSYFYCPVGPVANDKLFDFLFSEINKIAKREKVVFLRFEPEKIINKSEFKIKRTIDIQPSKTVIINLEKTEEEILKAMHQKTRYNIRLAEKKSVKINELKAGEFDNFWKLMTETVNRDGFRLHNKEHYKKLSEVDGIKIFFGEHDGVKICAGIFSFFGDTVTYLHGASSNEHREVMAPYLLHWEMVKYSKNNGFKKYDFYGIDEKKWPGVTRFKTGFTKEEIKYSGTFDLIFDKFFYFIYIAGRRIRRLF